MHFVRAGLQTLPPNARGSLWIVASAICFTAATSLVKLLGHQFPAAEQVFWTQFISSTILLPFISRNRVEIWRSDRRRLLIGRAALSTLSIILSYYAFHTLSMTDANAISFTRSLWIVPLSALLLRERIKTDVALAGLVAFSGVLLISGAGTATSQPLLGVAAALSSAICAALLAIAVRSLSQTMRATIVLVWSSVLGLAVSFPVALASGFVVPRRWELLLMLVQAVCTMGQQLCYIRGLQIGEASAVAPFDYTRVVFVILVGVIAYDEWPSRVEIAGLAAILSGALYVMWSHTRTRTLAV